MSDKTEKALVKAYLEERDVLISHKQRAENAEAQLTALREELASVLTDWNALVKASGSPTNGGAVGHVVALKTELAALREKQQGEWNAAIDAAISGARECLLCDADVIWDNNTPQVGDGTAANRAVEYVIKAIRALLRQPSEQPKATL